MVSQQLVQPLFTRTTTSWWVAPVVRSQPITHKAIELQLTHPLMRGRGTLVNRIPVVLARINEDIALHDFEANVRNLVKATEDSILGPVLRLSYSRVGSTVARYRHFLWRVASERAKAGGPPEAEAQARGLLGTFQNQIIAAKQRLQRTRQFRSTWSLRPRTNSA